MLTNKQKAKIRDLRIFESAEQTENGKLINGFGKEFSMPEDDEIIEMAFKKLENAGFSKIKRVSPNKANCIIRISRTKNFLYQEFTINYFEVNFYTKKKNLWIMKDIEGDEYTIDYSSHNVCFYVKSKDEPPVVIEANFFFDLYVEVN